MEMVTKSPHLQQQLIDLVQLELCEPGGHHGGLGSVVTAQARQPGGQEELRVGKTSSRPRSDHTRMADRIHGHCTRVECHSVAPWSLHPCIGQQHC
jgi:hypothetical protein